MAKNVIIGEVSAVQLPVRFSRASNAQEILQYAPTVETMWWRVSSNVMVRLTVEPTALSSLVTTVFGKLEKTVTMEELMVMAAQTPVLFNQSILVMVLSTQDFLHLVYLFINAVMPSSSLSITLWNSAIMEMVRVAVKTAAQILAGNVSPLSASLLFAKESTLLDVEMESLTIMRFVMMVIF